MKKVILLITILFSLNLFAESAEDKMERKMDMQTVSVGLELIQKGILSNNTSLTKTGIMMLKKGQQKMMETHGEDLKQYLPSKTAFAYKFAKASAKRISDYTEEINEDIKNSKDYSRISAAYMHIMNECAGCHLKIRK